MKKTPIYLIGILVLSLLFSCNPSIEKQLIGTWETTTVEFANIDEVGQFVYDTKLMSYEQDIADKIKLIDETGDQELVQIYQAQLSVMQDDMDELSLDGIKQNWQNIFDTLSFTIIFNEDFSFENTEFENPGTWELNEENRTIAIDIEGKENNYQIININKHEMLLSLKNGDDDYAAVLEMVFVKN